MRFRFGLLFILDCVLSTTTTEDEDVVADFADFAEGFLVPPSTMRFLFLLDFVGLAFVKP